MAGTTTRPPQELLNQYDEALGLISLIRAIAFDKEVGKNILQASDALSAAQELSKLKKAEFEQAQSVIDNADKFVEKINAEKEAHEIVKKEHDQKVKYELANLATAKSELLALSESSRKELEKRKQDADKALIDAKELLLRASNYNQETKNLESQVLSAKSEHEKAVQEFEKYRKQISAEHEARLKDHEINVRKLVSEKQAFELKKKKLDEARAALSEE